jgi:hypothetical protein
MERPPSTLLPTRQVAAADASASEEFGSCCRWLCLCIDMMDARPHTSKAASLPAGRTAATRCAACVCTAAAAGRLHVQGRREVALLLVRRGAPTLVHDARGRTPLEAAAHGGSTLKDALLAEAAKSTRCAACCAGGSLKQCSRCKATAYCGAACQQAHWAVHRRTCREE